MLLTKQTTVKWNSRNKKYYTQKGYVFTKMKDEFLVDVDDLSDGSNSVVTLRCDYCGVEYDISWVTYKSIKKKEKVHKDSCEHCQQLKSKDSIIKCYGGYKEMYEKTNDTRESTNIEKYGCECVFANKDIKDKIVKTNLEKYGVKYNQQNKHIREKTMNTCRSRYGVDNYVELFKGKFIGSNSPVWIGGSNYSREERATNEYVQWRKSVFSRDRYKCVCCGNGGLNSKSVELHAHHILNWKDNCDKRYDVDNGATLCSDCHYKFHSTYGKTNTTQEQLVEFIDNIVVNSKKGTLNLLEQNNKNYEIKSS